MLKLINFSNHPADLGKFSDDSGKIMEFLNKHSLHGLELIQYTDWDSRIIPSSMIHGLHMRYWPIWLDFWKNDETELNRQFGSESIYTHYYGGKSRESIIEHYRNEINTACNMNAEYVVFHVSHVSLEHCYNYCFDYSDIDVVDSFVEMINEVFDGIEANFVLLLENLWWPGLTMMDKNIANKLLENINYPKKGFMLDIGHMMNTNNDLKDEAGAVDYIWDVLKNLGGISKYIKGIHLNSSLSGEYVKEQMQNYKVYGQDERFYDQYIKAINHISNIDRHIPFANPYIKRIIEHIDPKYLVYEFLADSLEELDGFVKQQNRVLGL